MAICPIICSFYYLARALMHDVAGEIACAEGCAETISANVLKDTLVRTKLSKRLLLRLDRSFSAHFYHGGIPEGRDCKNAQGSRPLRVVPSSLSTFTKRSCTHD